MPATTRQPNFALLLALAWLLIVCQLLAQNWADTAQTLLDTDDAMRLTQMRDWLAGRGWYDLLQPRVEPPLGYESHWSRLIDAGLAGTLWAFGRVFDPAMAERLMRTVWPMLWLLPTMVGATAIAWRIAGREAALVALLLALVGLPAFHQFQPGRIDHHNVQIALAVLAVAATVWSDRVRWTAWAAGALTGLALAIGLESLPYLFACGAAFALRYVIDRAGARAAADYGLALGASSVAAFFIIVGPDHWTRAVCDAIAINYVALVVIGGLGLMLAGSLFASDRMITRLVCALGIGVAAAALFGWIEPRCLHGPYGMVDPAVWPIWLAHVREMQPLTALMAKTPVVAIATAAFPAVALLATFVLLRDRALRRDFGFLAASAAFVAAAVVMLAAMKGYFYAAWLGIPLVAAFALHLFALLRLHALVPRFLVGLMLTPGALSAGAIGIANAAGLGEPDSTGGSAPACLKSASYAQLARLPAGLVAADVDFGPFILALTPHSVLAAPYHRLSTGIVAAHQVFASPPDQARSILARRSATYVVICGSAPPVGVSEAALSASLWAQLQAGVVPGWLDPVTEIGMGPFRAFRVRAEL
jgi:hypothetical protein